MKIICFKEDWGRTYYDVSTPERSHKVAIAVIKERLKDGWYYNDPDDESIGMAETDATSIAERNDGEAAWRFLNKRRDFEYEGFDYIKVIEL